MQTKRLWLDEIQLNVSALMQNILHGGNTHIAHHRERTIVCET